MEDTIYDSVNTFKCFTISLSKMRKFLVKPKYKCSNFNFAFIDPNDSSILYVSFI